jgi:hypothetical protein
MQYTFRYSLSLSRGLILPSEVVMRARLNLIPAMVEKLRCDRNCDREAAFCVAISEALANAINRGKPIQRCLLHQMMLGKTGPGNFSNEVLHG